MGTGFAAPVAGCWSAAIVTLSRHSGGVCDAEPMLVWSCALSSATQRLYLWEMDNAFEWRALREIEMGKPNIGPHALRLTSLPSERNLHPEM